MKSRFAKFCLSSRPQTGIVSLLSRDLKVAICPALIVGRVTRPSPGLSPRAHSRGRAPSPSTDTPNFIRSTGPCRDRETSRFHLFIPFWNLVLLLMLPGCRLVAKHCFDFSILRLTVGTTVSRPRLVAVHVRPLPPPLPYLLRCRLPSRFDIRVLLCTSSSIVKIKHSAY